MASATRLFSRIASSPVLLGASACGLGAVGYQGYAKYNHAASNHGSGFNSIFPIASASDPSNVKTTFPSSGFTKLVLEEAEMVNHNVKYLRFKLPEGDQRSGIKTITSLLTNHKPDVAWIPVFRPYTPIDADEPGHISFLVKQYPTGKGSSHMHSLKPGDELKVKPIHEFDYKPNQFSHVTILAGGAGITPFVQLIRHVLSNPEDKTKISLVYSNHSEDDILLKSEFDEFSTSHPDRFKATYVVSQPRVVSNSGIEKGRVTSSILEQALPAKTEWSQSKVLVCGPPPYIDAVAGQKGGFGWTQGSLGGMLKDLGLQKDQVQKF
ncbi:NADH-cytochrome b5 reductase-like protein 2 [Elsinoe australis]|uniref:NADH-cytochrome b5 reductase-like protein 2 n=1 Tax=Elsinoe australis TaxID=40998 RepID=A0A4U7ALF7_9PEZI|nr:NADH-cytochrome b5 reductase-like protein 2 [Elsinoe australis]